MSYVTSHLINETEHNAWTECPCCGEYLEVDENELKEYHNDMSVPIQCYECTTYGIRFNHLRFIINVCSTMHSYFNCRISFKEQIK